VLVERTADAARHAIGLLDIGVLPETPMVALNQQPAPRRARRDDLIALPSNATATSKTRSQPRQVESV
jgi:hypothetical protein